MDEIEIDGGDGNMHGHGSFMPFNSALPINLAHITFRVDKAQLDAIAARLHSPNIPFGNCLHGRPPRIPTVRFVMPGPPLTIERPRFPSTRSFSNP
jgi:hypothetical protein